MNIILSRDEAGRLRLFLTRLYHLVVVVMRWITSIGNYINQRTTLFSVIKYPHFLAEYSATNSWNWNYNNQNWNNNNKSNSNSAFVVRTYATT